MTQTEALKLALEALEYYDKPLKEYSAKTARDKDFKAIASIKEALAQPEQKPKKIGTIGHIGNGKTTLTAAITPLLAAQPDENLAATVSDEVILDVLGSIDYNPKHHKTPLTKYQIIELGQKMFELGSKNLYTTPPQRTWIGLTEEEAAECWSTSTVRTWQAIEAKLKEKNT